MSTCATVTSAIHIRSNAEAKRTVGESFAIDCGFLSRKATLAILLVAILLAFRPTWELAPADPVIVLNLIEAWNPQVAAMLHAFNREAVRGFIQADSILKESLNAPEFEKWFAAFYELIEEDNRDVDEGAEPGSKRVQ